MKYIITFILSLSLSIFMASSAAALSYNSDNTVAYNPFSGVCSTTGEGDTSSSPICANDNGNYTKASSDPALVKILSVIKLLDTVIGIAAVIMVIIGGIKFVTSSGESAGVASARNTIIFALVGLVVAVLAQLILALVINHLG
jgi:hypothetical protein